MIWVYLFFRVILAVAIIGVGVGFVRNVESRSGLMLAAAGGVQLLTTCCLRGISMGATPGNRVFMLLGSGVNVVSGILFIGLIAAALITLSKELTRRKGATADAPPKIF